MKMKDGYGREITYLRVSITDKCNLRCGYCMPKEGIRHLSHGEVLTLEETARLARIFTELGIRRVRLTGGEPLVRRGAVSLVEMLRRGGKPEEIVMTSNGILLPQYAASLKAAGLDGINISLDTLDKEAYGSLTGLDGLDSVIKGIDSAVNTGLKVCLNCVPMRGINDTELEKLADFAQSRGAGIRFIELMPIGCGAYYKGIPTDEILGRMEKRYGAYTREKTGRADEIKGPAEYYRFEGYEGSIGFISPISHKFCESCDRVRLTAEGYLKLCLQYPQGADLKTPLRNGASDEIIKDMIKDAVKRKPAAHTFQSRTAETDMRKMIQIGG